MSAYVEISSETDDFFFSELDSGSLPARLERGALFLLLFHFNIIV